MVLVAAAAAPGASDVSIVARQGWSGVFAGRRVDIDLQATAQDPFDGRLQWSFAVNGATLARREASLTAAPNSPGKVRLSLQVPDVKPGIVTPAVLSIAVRARSGVQAATSLTKRLWIFPDDPFYERYHWLEQLSIHLFDPLGKTRRVLKTAKIPFTRIDNLDTLADLNRGVLVTGQGISLKEYPGLADVLFIAASRGTAVLCLAPADGQLTLPGTGEDDFPQPSSVTLRRTDVIRALDKRLDAVAWPEDGRILASGLAIRSDRGQVVAQVTRDESDWAWLEARFGPGRGRLIVCGFDLMGKWETGPTPRFLFARLLEYLDETNTLSFTKGDVR